MVRQFYNFHLSERKWISLLFLFSFAGNGTGVLIVRHLHDFIKYMHLWKFVEISSNFEFKLEFRSYCFHIGASHIDYIYLVCFFIQIKLHLWSWDVLIFQIILFDRPYINCRNFVEVWFRLNQMHTNNIIKMSWIWKWMYV